jgi:hypothetical protein
MWKDMEGLPETLKKAEEGGREHMGDPILFWTLLAVIAANIILVVLALANARR